MGGSAMAAPAMSASGTKATTLRSGFNNLLQEHVYLAAAATGAALGGRDAEFKAAAAAPSSRRPIRIFPRTSWRAWSSTTS